MHPSELKDPFLFAKALWPHVYFYDKQREIIASFRDNYQTFVPAANKLGKDFVSGFLVLWFFMTRHPCRVVTTSVDGDQLRGVLWGEIRRFISTSQYPLEAERGGPLIVNHLQIRKIYKGRECGVSYAIGRVAARGEGLLGHHVTPETIEEANDKVPRTAAFFDEASAIDEDSYAAVQTWAGPETGRILGIGNCWPCENFFKHAVKGKPGTEDKGGDIRNEYYGNYERKVIRIRAVDSPNVQYGLVQERAGIKPTNEVLVPGVKSYFEYLSNRKRWDPMRQQVGLDADWYEGADTMLYPGPWLDRAERMADDMRGMKRIAKAMGVDSAEGGDSTVWCIMDDFGVIDVISKKTRNTAEIPNFTVHLIDQYDLDPTKVAFDRGGGGYEHCCTLAERGFPVRSVGFGEAVNLELRHGKYTLAARKEAKAEKYAYLNRRVEMYAELRHAMDPDGDPIASPKRTFAIPAKFAELRRQLSKVPIWYNEKGRMFLPPKRRTAAPAAGAKKLVTMNDLLGCSPDEADACVLGNYVLHMRAPKSVASAA